MPVRIIFISIMCLIMQHGSTGQTQVKPLDIDLAGYQYPYAVQFLKLSIQKVNYKMAYMSVKSVHPNGETIVLLHGKNFNGAYWGQTAKALSEKGYRVIIPDQIGFGKSSKPEQLQYSFELLAQNTKALLDTLGVKKAVILGHSMGGMLAIRFTLMYPDAVGKLILADPIGLEDYGAMVPYQSVDTRYKLELAQTYDKLKEYELKSYYHNEWKPSYDEWLDLSAGWFQSEDYPRIAWDAALTYDMIMTQPVCHELQNIQTPTLLIIGQSDSAVVGKEYASPEVKKTMGNYSKLGKDAHAKISNSQLVELQGVGHLPHIEAFDRFIKAVEEFLVR